MHIASTTPRPRWRVTVMGTTDLHGYIRNWDYFADREYDDSFGNDIGLAKIATLIHRVRAECGSSAASLLLDSGDTIQGSPLAYYRARVAPIDRQTVHPMAAVMNHLGYHAAAVGNHEFNYGLAHLRRFQSQLRFPLLAANVYESATGAPAFTPYIILETTPPGAPQPIRVGVLGLTTPGAAIWDHSQVDGILEFGGVVEAAERYVPQLRARGADIVIVLAHSGATTSSSYGMALPYPENASTLLAEKVPGIHAIVVGHAHLEIAEHSVRNRVSGRDVLLTEPLCWGMRLSVIDIDLEYVDGAYSVLGASSRLLNANSVDEDPEAVELVSADHKATLEYVRSPIGQCTDEIASTHATTRQTAAIALVNYVQASAVAADLRGTDYADLPVLSMASPFGSRGRIPRGAVTIANMASLYPVDNYLQAQVLTGAELRAHLEHAAEFFARAQSSADNPVRLTHAVTARTPDGMPDFDFDAAGGLDASLTYDIDLARETGDRIVGLRYAGVPVSSRQRFVVALNNFRASGSGGYPGTSERPSIYRPQHEVRQLLIDWVRSVGVVDATRFSRPGWRLTYHGTPLSHDT